MTMDDMPTDVDWMNVAKTYYYLLFD